MTTYFADGSSGNSDLVFSAFDNTNGVGYTFDLGVALNAILGADNATTGTAVAANAVLGSAYTSGVIYDGALDGFDAFVSAASAISNIEWNLAAADSSGRSRVLMTQGDDTSAVTMNNSKVAYVANSYLNYTQSVAATVGTSVDYAQTTTTDNAAYAGGATWANTGGISGVVDNTNILSNGSSAILEMYSQTSTLANKAGVTSYSAQVSDAAGNPLTAMVYQDGSGVWKLKVFANDTTAPSVSGVDYGTNDGVLQAGEAVNLVVHFSENVIVAGTGAPTLTLSNGAVATYVSGSGSGDLTFNYNPASGDASSSDLAVSSLNLGSSTIKDAAGNDAVLTGASVNPTGTLAVDATAPTVTSFSPVDEAASVAGTTNIVVNFSEAVTAGSGNIVITNASGTVVETIAANSANVTISGSTVTINPTSDLANANTYSVSFEAGSFKDVAGNNYAGTSSYNFSTPAFANGASGNSDLVFSAFDNTTGVGYTFDIGVTLNAILSADNATTGTAVAANGVLGSAYTNGVIYDGALSDFSTFLGSASSLSNVEWNIAAADSNGRGRVLMSQGDDTSTVTMNNSKVSYVANSFLNYTDAVASKVGNVANSAQTTTTDNAAYAGGATWGNTGGLAGVVDNTNVVSDGSTANLYLYSQTSTLANKAGTTSYSTQVKDANGTALTATIYQDGDGVWKLQLKAQDLVAPTVTSFTPSDDSTNVAVSADIVVTFSENVVAGAGNILIKDSAGNLVESIAANSSNVTISGNTVTINPNTTLDSGVNYSVEFDASSIKDAAGNNYAGTNTYNFTTTGKNLTGASAAETFTGSAVADTINAGGGNDTVYGLDGNDALSGGIGNDMLDGGAGNDSLNGGAGIDTMLGGLGNDTFTVDNAADVITEAANEGTDTVNVAINTVGGTYILADNVENANLANTVNYNLTGNALNNILRGNLANNVIDGGLGVDTLLLNNATLAVTANLATGLVTGGVGNDTISNIENLTGSNFNDSLTGDAGNNVLNGGLGADTMIGGAGNDTYTVDNSGDVISEVASEGADTVNLTIATVGGSYTLSANVENANLSNSVNFNLTGNDLNNTLRGNLANNVIDGGAGVDTLLLTNATSGVNANLATGLVTGGAGSDTISNIENLTGSNFNDVLKGDAGNNKLVGGNGDDVLFGGLGNDTLTGGAGSDTFVFNSTPNAASNSDVITDFEVGTDHLSFDTSIYTALIGADASDFASGAGMTKATDAATHLIYNTTNGVLYYDADGVGGTAAVKIATIAGHPDNLDFNDLMFI